MIDLNEVQPITRAATTSPLSVAEVADRLNSRIEELARSLLGEPNSALSTLTQLRFRRKGSVAVEIGGEKQGQWYDHENGEGGDGLALICRELELANGAACAWAMDWLGIESGSAPPASSKMQRQAVDPETIADDEDATMAAKVAAIVGECIDLLGTPGERYLRSRGSPPPWAPRAAGWDDTPWSDRDDYLVAEWLQQQGILVPASVAGQAVETVARDQTFHPVREYLEALCWDGQPRLDAWLISYLGAPDTAYVRAVGSRWLTSAVARVFIPAPRPTAR